MEGAHANDDLLSSSGLPNKAGKLIDVADTDGTWKASGIGVCRIRIGYISIAWSVKDDSCYWSIVQHSEISSISSLLIEGVVTGASPQLIVQCSSSVLYAGCVTGIQVLHDWDVCYFRASADKSVS